MWLARDCPLRCWFRCWSAQFAVPAEYTKDPAELLANLNQRLIGRTRGGFSTALVAQIAGDGLVTIANAGHLPPYLDGKEVELPGALPLGIASGVKYETSDRTKLEGMRLTFYSDGVVEAQNKRGELFGFEGVGRFPPGQPQASLKQQSSSARRTTSLSSQFNASRLGKSPPS